MSSSHVSFVSFPHPPHVYPTLPIASALVRRGYRVTYATSERFSSDVQSIRAEVILCPRFDIEKCTSRNDNSAFRYYFDLTTDTLETLAVYYENQKPDLLIYDATALAGRIVAHRMSVPSIKTSPTFAFDKEHFLQQTLGTALSEQVLEHARMFDPFLDLHGISNADFTFYREGLNIHLFPKQLQPPGDVFGQEFFYAGRCAAEQQGRGSWSEAPDGGRPIVLVAGSTTILQGPAYFKMCIEALRGLNCHVVLSIGDHSQSQSLRPLPPDFEIVQGVSHIRILPHASLFICLGGIVSTAEATYHGVPLLVTSHGLPELEWQGENIVRLGLGLHLRREDTNAEHLRAAAIRISESIDIRDRLRRMKYAVRREPGGEETANRIEEYLDSIQEGESATQRVE